MCGIFGAITKNGLPEEKIEEVKRILRHRGPDDCGKEKFKLFDNTVVDFVHLRLSIIDLSKNGHQPMQDESGNFAIIYNGEIYNFREIKEELKCLGYKFFSNSDTEVILKSYIQWQQGCLDKFRGMFAFAIIDKKNDVLFIARDHFGIKPLYYFHDKENFVFSSELKALLAFNFVKKELNKEALVAYLNYLWPDTDESIFKYIYKLPKANYLIIGLNGATSDFKIYKYWDLNETIKYSSEKNIILELDQCLNESIKYHMISDVEVSSFLSGGLDSSLICALAKNYNHNLSTYTISFSDTDKKIEKMSDDSGYAQYLSKRLKLNHTEIKISPKILEVLPEVVYHLDEPIADPAALNTYLICKEARARGVKVMLSGMGADEIFSGYRRHYALLLAQRYKQWPFFFRQLLSVSAKMFPVRVGNCGLRQARWLKRFLSFADLENAEAYQRSYSYYGKDELKHLLKFDCNKEVDGLYERHEEIFSRKYRIDLINKMCWTDLNLFMPHLNLTYTDRVSMANSVEVRVPFIDRMVVQLAMSIPGNLKTKGRNQKYILKKISEKYLPKKIVYRQKASFGAPLRSWISGEMKDIVDELIYNKSPLHDLLDMKMIKQFIDNDRQGSFDYSYNIYQFLNLKEWFRVFLN